MLILLIAFLTSFFLGLFVIYFRHSHQHITGDFVDSGPQKMHTHTVPRIGGILIYAGVFFAFLVIYFKKRIYYEKYFILYAISSFSFICGLLEDLTKKVKPWIRILVISIAALLSFYFMDNRIVRVDIPILDNFLRYEWFSLVFTVFAIVGLTNSINIIDGFNGLASVV
ncbi:MAG: glycosyltransferase, partial [Candidatus Eremiobacterota bacterium]